MINILHIMGFYEVTQVISLGDSERALTIPIRRRGRQGDRAESFKALEEQTVITILSRQTQSHYYMSAKALTTLS